MTQPRSVWLDGDALRWELQSANPSIRAPTGAMLDAFVRLADVPEEKLARAVERFADRWTVLQVCRHDLPVTHVPPGWRASWRHVDGLPLGCPAKLADDGGPTEPIWLWREMAGYVAACRRIARALAAGRKADPGDWQLVEATTYAWGRRADVTTTVTDDELQGLALATIGVRAPRGPVMFQRSTTPSMLRVEHHLEAVREHAERLARRNRSEQQQILQDAVNRLLELADARVRWDGGRRVIRPPPYSLGLLASIGSLLTEDRPVCAACGIRTGVPSKFARPGENTYCTRCRKNGGPARVASREYRARNRGVAHHGVTP